MWKGASSQDKLQKRPDVDGLDLLDGDMIRPDAVGVGVLGLHLATKRAC